MSEFNDDATPIRWSKRLMHIKANIVDSQKTSLVSSRKSTILKKYTGNTIKKMNNTITIKTCKIHYGSHSHKCYACLRNPKVIQKENTDFKRYVVKNEIKEAY